MNPMSMMGAARANATGGSNNPKNSLNKLIAANKDSHKAISLSHLGGVQLTHELGGESPSKEEHYLFRESATKKP